MDYEDHLDRAIEESADVEASGDRFSVPDPEVRQEGKMTVYENFDGTVDVLNRDANHVMKFLQNELGTSGHIDESGRARLTGSFRQSRVADALDAYVEGYVTCSECGSPDTHLQERQGTTVLKCDACGALSSVSQG
ncbi:translation initiation factor IF-2 subunit beta [Haloarchaeobius amylolyticus]|uniref:translation initiation factor IF-2 subunit beta n=1 Tax=Haloarchaeobius amylolyticus TaxID=1198296 RepID=UPI00226F8A39|nr:translation initiation factor IF-2 subunit beta [Haloarchaeobius amylolyticus]